MKVFLYTTLGSMKIQVKKFFEAYFHSNLEIKKNILTLPHLKALTIKKFNPRNLEKKTVIFF